MIPSADFLMVTKSDWNNFRFPKIGSSCVLELLNQILSKRFLDSKWGIDQSNICGMVGKKWGLRLSFYKVLIGIIQFGALSDSFTNVQIANMKQDLELIAREVAGRGLRLNFYAGKRSTKD